MKRSIIILLILCMLVYSLSGCTRVIKQALYEADDANHSTNTPENDQIIMVEEGTTTTDATDSPDQSYDPYVTTVQAGTLTVAINAYFPPFEYYEGNQIVGIDAEIAAEIAKRLNISRASVYRALDKLIEEGKIEKSGNTLSIKKQ